MNKPKDLDDIASKFWTRHAKRLEAAGLLTDATADAFVLLCKTYSHLHQLDPSADKNGWIRYFALLKWYQTYARGFDMNTDKPRKLKETTQEPDECGL
jgi:phage terminase small subunit